MMRTLEGFYQILVNFVVGLRSEFVPLEARDLVQLIDCLAVSFLRVWNIGRQLLSLQRSLMGFRYYAGDILPDPLRIGLFVSTFGDRLGDAELLIALLEYGFPLLIGGYA